MPRKSNGSTAPNPKKKTVAAAKPAAVPAVAEMLKTVQDARLEEEIRRRAYEIYLERQGSPGDEHQDWLNAEREIRARHQQERIA